MAIIAVLSKTFQLVGAIVTALGLQYAFLREKYGHSSIITLIKMFFKVGQHPAQRRVVSMRVSVEEFSFHLWTPIKSSSSTSPYPLMDSSSS